MEVWADIKGYENIYEVSNFGSVRTKNGKTTQTKKHGTRKWKQRILKPRGRTYKTGYRVSLWKDGNQRDFLVARLVAFTFYGMDINDRTLTVDHIDGNRFNNELKNLQIVSLKENIQRAFENGLYKQKMVVIENMETKEKKICRSFSQASKEMGKNNGYISSKLKNNVYSNGKYRWFQLEESEVLASKLYQCLN